MTRLKKRFSARTGRLGKSPRTAAAVGVGGGPSNILFNVDFTTGTITPSVGTAGSFARASAAFRYDSNGYAESISANNPRYHHTADGATALGVLLERERTNVLLHSGDINNAAWSITNAVVPTANQYTGIGNTTTADQYGEGVDPAGNKLLSQTPTVTEDTVYTLMMYVADDDMASTHSPTEAGYALQVYDFNSNFNRVYYQFSDDTTHDVAGTQIDYGVVDGPNSFKLAHFTHNTDAGSNTLRVDISPAIDNSPYTRDYDSSLTDANFKIDEVWMVADVYHTVSHVPTTAAATTYNADNLNYPVSNLLTNDFELDITFIARDYSLADTTVDVPYVYLFESGDMSVLMNDTDIIWRPSLGTELRYVTTGFTEGTSTRIVCKKTTSGAELYLDDVLVDSNVTAQYQAACQLGTNFYVGCDSNVENHADTSISSIQIRST